MGAFAVLGHLTHVALVTAPFGTIFSSVHTRYLTINFSEPSVRSLLGFASTVVLGSLTDACAMNENNS
jgi:hypothetical protein